MIDKDNKIILKPIQNATLENIKGKMIRYIRPDSIIITDERLNYNFFEECRWKHEKCIHTIKTKYVGGFSTDKIVHIMGYG